MKHASWLLILLLSGCGGISQTLAPVEDAGSDVLPEPPIPKTHVIRSGETLVEIGLDYGLDYRDIARWNGIINPHVIRTGQTLALRSPKGGLPSVSGLPQADVPPAALSSEVTPIQPTIVPESPSIVPVDVSPTPLIPIPPISPPPATSPSALAPTYAPVKQDEAQEDGQNNNADAPIKSEPSAQKYAYSPETLERLRTESASLVGAPQQTRKRFGIDWSWPVAGDVIRKFSDASKGIDIMAARGAPVYAAAAGKVVYTGVGVKSYGRLVILKHDNDYLSAYAHNDAILTEEGKRVARGQQIATVGDSGAAQVMLHLEIRKAGKPFDPLKALPTSP